MTTEVCIAQQGSNPAPTRPESAASPVKCCGLRETAVPSEELATVARPLRLSTTKIGECDARTECGAPRIAREHRPGLRIDLRHHEWGGRAA